MNLQALFLKSSNEIVEEEMLTSAAMSESPGGYEDTWSIEHVTEFLLENPTAEVTEEVMRSAAGNKTNGRPLMRLLLSHPRNRVLINSSTISMAASNPRQGDVVMKISDK